jgi:hypothetical protein
MWLHLYITIPSRLHRHQPARHLPPGRSRDGAAGVSALAGRLHHHVAGQVLGQVLLHLGRALGEEKKRPGPQKGLLHHLFVVSIILNRRTYRLLNSYIAIYICVFNAVCYTIPIDPIVFF